MRVTPVTVRPKSRSRIFSRRLGAVGQDDFGMADAAIETGEQGGGFGSDDGGFEIGTSEGADGVEGAPGGFDDDFDFAFEASSGNGGAEIAGDAAEFGQDIFGKVLYILGQLRFGRARGPAPQDVSG